jgi:hypothetical protein
MKNWKTSLSAVVTAFFMFVLFDPQWFPLWMISIAKFASIGGLISMGINSKDRNVTGGTVTQPTVSNPPSLLEK